MSAPMRLRWCNQAGASGRAGYLQNNIISQEVTRSACQETQSYRGPDLAPAASQAASNPQRHPGLSRECACGPDGDQPRMPMIILDRAALLRRAASTGTIEHLPVMPAGGPRKSRLAKGLGQRPGDHGGIHTLLLLVVQGALHVLIAGSAPQLLLAWRSTFGAAASIGILLARSRARWPNLRC